MVIIIVLSHATVLPRSFFIRMYYETDVMLCSAWSSFLELGQAHYKKKKKKKICYQDRGIIIIIIIIDRFYIALFSTLLSRLTALACDST